MKKNEQLAWDLLTPNEQNSLFLTLGKGLSSWESGEMLKIAHYKYLELKERAEKFFKMYTEYFEDCESLIRPQAPLDSRFKDYIYACIEKRLTKPKAIQHTGDSSLCIGRVSREHILKNMAILKESDNPWDIKLFKLIMEFDRWNNWRILPRSIQAPSAYKRRNNKREKIYIGYMNKLPTYKVSAIYDIYKYSRRKPSKGCYYICLISKELFTDGYEVIPVKMDEDTISSLSKLFIYVFQEKEFADILGYQVTSFESKINKPTLGQKFWPQFRDNIQRAVNYGAVNNIDFYTERLDMAYNIKRRAPKDKAIKTTGAQRASEKIFEK